MISKEWPAMRPGERSDGQGKAIGNKILLAIPQSEYRRIRPHLRFVALPSHLSLHEPFENQGSVYFPNSGMLSLVVVTGDGRTVEVGMVGNEGIAGMPSYVGVRRSPLREVVQIEGSASRIFTKVLERTLEVAPRLQLLLNRHAVLQSLQMGVTAACNRLHPADQRLARWLLMAQDRVDAGVLQITHDFLATMLGTDRPTVTLAAQRLQKSGLIRYSRGAVEILNRNKLESRSCECYRTIQQFNGPLGLR
jgi:CRP-like cAMP-binding protein